MQDLVEEFLINNWTTYGVIELNRSRHDEDPKVEAKRLDKLTRILMNGNKASVELAQKLISDWLKRPASATYPYVRAMRLRRVFALKQLKDYQRAISECQKLLVEDPESATLNCLLGNLYGWLGTSEGWKAAIHYFEKADEIADGWWEPRLEQLDKMFYLGAQDSDYWRQITVRTSECLNRPDEKTNRETLILIAYRAVAQALIEPKHIGSAEFSHQVTQAERIQIPVQQQEDWSVEEIYRIAVRARYPGDDEPTREIRNRIRDFLADTQEKLMPGAKWQE
jgi:tetratricopeptide (TPR) repeat protein